MNENEKPSEEQLALWLARLVEELKKDPIRLIASTDRDGLAITSEDQ